MKHSNRARMVMVKYFLFSGIMADMMQCAAADSGPTLTPLSLLSPPPPPQLRHIHHTVQHTTLELQTILREVSQKAPLKIDTIQHEQVMLLTRNRS